VTELLDESEIWKSYSSQRHDLFIEDRPVLAIQSGTTHAGYLTQVFYPLLSISLNTHEGFDRSGKRPAAVLSKHVQFHQDHPLLSSAIFVKKIPKSSHYQFVSSGLRFLHFLRSLLFYLCQLRIKFFTTRTTMFSLFVKKTIGIIQIDFLY